ncbi:MAG: hypothetical protein AAF328_10435 [Planctomycetota bacterium]
MTEPTHQPQSDASSKPAGTPGQSGRKRKARNRCRHVLLLQPTGQPRTAQLAAALEACGDAHHPVRVVAVPDADQARHYLADHRVDLAIVPPTLPESEEHSGIDFTAELTSAKKPTATIVLADQPNFEVATEAMRAGACDFLVHGDQTDQPDALKTEHLKPAIDRAIKRRLRDVAINRRIKRLRRLCRQLNEARIDVSHQVDVLCSDLVTAYQELAQQFQNTVQTSEFKGIVSDELDLETLLRKTLEYLVSKAGATNAAIFLPATLDEYSLGGYVNYDCTADSADMLLEHLADVIAPKLAEQDEYVHFQTNAQLHDWFDADAAYLDDSEVIGIPCHAGADDDRECLAVVVLFRDRDTPFDEAALDACSSLGEALGTALEKVIRVHHRVSLTQDESDYAGDSGGSWDDSASFDDHYGEADDPSGDDAWDDDENGTLPF